MPIFIAFAGKKQVGKNESANICHDLLVSNGKIVQITSFATPLKEFCIDILGLPRNLIYGNDRDKNISTHIMWDNLPAHICTKYATITASKEIWQRKGPMTIREVLQIVGTDIVREMLWQDAWAGYPFRQEYFGEVILIPDMRFPNEYEALKKANGYIIRLRRNTGLTDNHPSEIALDNEKFEYEYENNGSLQELETYLMNFLKKINLLV